VTAETAALRRLARLYGVMPSYKDAAGAERHVSADSLLAVLRCLGARVDRMRDVESALRDRSERLQGRVLDDVCVVWDGSARAVRVRLPHRFSGRVDCTLVTEDGGIIEWPRLRRDEIRGCLTLPSGLPHGYHQLTVEAAGSSYEALIISAPGRAAGPASGGLWGVFLPLYAQRSEGDWGAGDLTGLARLAEWTGSLGGGIVGTLPLLAAHLSEPFEPSPYSPASRLFLNEFYIDVTRIPELKKSAEARRLAGSPQFQAEVQALRSARLVDYRRTMALKRRVLALLASEVAGERAAALRGYVERTPALKDYARFRAAGDRFGCAWASWPAPARGGRLREQDYGLADERYHLYAQWIADEQMQALNRSAEAAGVQLYLDLPLGVGGDSYDVWRQREVFATGACGGAPPDLFYSRGQNWGFPPLNPEALRRTRYRYVIAVLRRLMSYCGGLRIDHVMALHRLYWVPEGLEAGDGAYVRYPAGELYAILCLESQRQGTFLAGEDLGTVPPYVRAAMARHNMLGMHVLQFALSPDGVQRPAASSVASLNTHDTPTFAGFWQGRDIDERVELGLLTPEQAEAERETRAGQRASLLALLRRRGFLEGGGGLEEVTRAAHFYLAAGHAQAVLVNLEDLWNETEPQNVPGTAGERPNWRRKAALAQPDFERDPAVTSTLEGMDRLRRSKGRRD
jgi:4-alpha-glucanotransferase